MSEIVIDKDAQWFELLSKSKLIIESGLNNCILDLGGLGLYSLLEFVIIRNEDILLYESVFVACCCDNCY